LAWALVQSAPVPAAAQSQVLTFGAGTTAGNLLLAAVGVFTGTHVLTPPANWTLVAHQVDNTTGAGDLYIYAYYNNPGGITSQTWATTSGGFVSALMHEFSGGIGALDQIGTNSLTVGGVTGTVTTSSAIGSGDLAFAAFYTTAGNTFVAGAGYNITVASNAYSAADEHNPTPTGGLAQTATITWTGSSKYVAAIGCFSTGAVATSAKMEPMGILRGW
jgi:hypothetical protein